MERDTVQSSSSGGPGATLRQAREQRQLSVDDVARSLNLTPQRISAIERDAYEQLPGPTYVRGYLRGYAQLLGLPVQPLLDAFNQSPVAAQRTEMIAPAPAGDAHDVTSDDVLMKVGIIGVAILVLGMGVLWWSGNGESDDVSSPSSAAIDAVSPSTDIATTEQPADSAPTSTTEAQPEAVAAAPTVNESNVPQISVVLRVREDSWVDVRDASDNRLVYQTVSAGRTLNLQGVPPLTVFLGNVSGVDVEFNGRPYDALRHRRGEVARFSLQP